MTTTDIKTELDKHGYIVYQNKGTSMMPLIRQGKDLMNINARKGEKLEVGDAVLFLRGNEYILHRIVCLLSDGSYLICGDNQKTAEKVEDDQILGILTGIIRDGKEISVNDSKYKRYVKAILEFRQPVQNARALLSRSKRALKRILGL